MVFRILLSFCFPLLVTIGYGRIWTNVEGQQIEAELIEIDDESVRLRLKSDNRIYEYPIGDLSQSDQDYLANRRTRKLVEQTKVPGNDLSIQSRTGEIGNIGRGSDFELKLPGNIPLEMLWVKPGEFLMGSPESESRSTRQVHVVLSRGYWLGKYEVTFSHWIALMGRNPRYGKRGGYPERSYDEPQIAVSWEAAMAFCKRLNERERKAGRLPRGYEYSLPTEAQWEYACRAGSKRRFCFGYRVSDLADYAWYRGSFSNRPRDRGKPTVGELLPNAWGFYDMHGNVWEHCFDMYKRYPSGTVVNPIAWYPENETEKRIDPNNPRSAHHPSHQHNVSRGGALGSNARECSAFYRRQPAKGQYGGSDGFRLALRPTVNLLRFPEATSIRLLSIDTYAIQAVANGTNQAKFGPGLIRFPSQPYSMSEKEITQAQYNDIMHKNPSEHNIGMVTAPVDSVSAEEALEFCRRLTELEIEKGNIPSTARFDLPTETEWEFACRSGTITDYSFGDAKRNLELYANYKRTKKYGGKYPAPVGSYIPNKWGFYDMHGNLSEWCYQDASSGSIENRNIDKRKNMLSTFSVRGGDWDSRARYCQSDQSKPTKADRRKDTMGFRIVLRR